MSDKIYLTESRLAELLNISVRSLQGQRQRGGGIPFIKIGRSVRYDPAVVQEYLGKCKRVSTSDTGEAALGGGVNDE